MADDTKTSSDACEQAYDDTVEHALPDARRYLADDCYCPGEIYDISGFFYRILEPDDPCRVIARSDDMTALVSGGDDPQIFVFWHDDEGDNPERRILDAQRVDVTPNNVSVVRDLIAGKDMTGRRLDEAEPGSMRKRLSEVMSLADAVMVDG